MIIAETDRLNIRTWQERDIEDYAKIVSDPHVMRYIGNGLPQHFETAEKYVRNCMSHIETRGWARFAVEIKATKELAGFCGYAEYNNELDLGWRYAKKYWHQGYGTEAAQKVLDLGLDHFGFKRIVCIADINNHASIKIIKKIGLVFEKQFILEERDIKQYTIVN